MKAADHVNLWSAPDNSRLTTAELLSFRLPVHVTTKLSALCDLYPNKTRTEIVGDLLATALLKIEKALPTYDGRELCTTDAEEVIYEEPRQVKTFRDNADKYYKELERELGNASTRGIYTQGSYELPTGE
jgi:hypothetical protein